MFFENILFDSVGSDVGLWQEFLEAGSEAVVSIVVTFGRLDNKDRASKSFKDPPLDKLSFAQKQH